MTMVSGALLGIIEEACEDVLTLVENNFLPANLHSVSPFGRFVLSLKVRLIYLTTLNGY